MLRTLVLSTFAGVLLTGLFWPRLWQGGGFIGGDTYTYFLPQKAFYADRLRAGEFPFWNYLTGHGYPILGESQTAALYPLNPLLYSTLDLNTAYVASHLFHYVLAFVGVWLLAERLRLNRWGAVLAGIVYVYGWFPPRACLEWAIIGGAYLPLCLWSLEGWLKTSRLRHLLALAGWLALDLLAGHYNLAFITTFALAGYALLRSIFRSSPTASQNNSSPFRALLLTAVFVGLGYGLAAPQLAPSWSLKQASQRLEVNPEFDPGYGHIPPLYLSQVALPWLWFGEGLDPDRVLHGLSIGRIDSLTNKVEAHLYFGLLPLLLAATWCIRTLRRPDASDAPLRCLVVLGLFGVVYATGWLLPIAKQLPGFGYFRGPGRWGILAELAVALTAGSVVSRATVRAAGPTPHQGWGNPLTAALVVALTTLDLYWVSRQQWYTFTVSDPAINHRQESTVGRLLRTQLPSGPPRVLAPGANLATLTGIAATPPYLGFGPDAYYLLGGRLPDPRFLSYLSGELLPEGVDVAAQFDWLRAAGVTHILSMKPLPYQLPVWRDWLGYDPLLHAAWARDPAEPLRLFSINQASGRLYLRRLNEPPEPIHDPDDPPPTVATPAPTARLTHYSANRVSAAVSCHEPVEVVLTDLPWPEWELTVNGVPAAEEPPGAESIQNAEGRQVPPLRLERRVRVSSGAHRLEWTYRPRSLWIGCAVSAASLLVLLGLTWGLRRSSAAAAGTPGPAESNASRV